MGQLYFKDRAEAGRQLAEQLKDLGNENCAVVALSEGGVIVGAQIAIKLHASLYILLTDKIILPGESIPLAAMSSSGGYTENNFYSAGELEEFGSEYFQQIEQQKMESFHRLNRLMGKDGEIKREYLTRHVIILVSDGLNSGFSLDIAADFLKPIAAKKLIVATPVANVQAVDRMHILTDKIHCLSVAQEYLTTNHYYADNTMPSKDGLMQLIKDISLEWQN